MADNLNRMEELKNRIRAQLTLKMEQPPKEKELDPGFHLEGYSNEEIGQALDELHASEEVFGVCGAQVKVDGQLRVELSDSGLSYEERQNILANLYRKNAIGGSTQPQLEFRFLFWLHSTAGEMASLREELSQADVYAPEIGGVTDNAKLETLLNDLSYGRITSEQILDSKEYPRFKSVAYWRHLIECVANSGKPIIVAEKEISWDTLLMDRDSFLKPYQYFKQGDLAEAIKHTKNHVRDLGCEVSNRETIFIQTLKQRLQSLPEFCPELQHKTAIRVLSGFGRVHAFTLPPLILKEFPDSTFSSSFQLDNTVFTVYEQLLSRVTAHSSDAESFSDLECARAILEQVILGQMIQNSSTYELVYREVSKLSLGQINTVAQRLAGGFYLISTLFDLGVRLPIQIAMTETIVLPPFPLLRPKIQTN